MHKHGRLQHQQHARSWSWREREKRSWLPCCAMQSAPRSSLRVEKLVVMPMVMLSWSVVGESLREGEITREKVEQVAEEGGVRKRGKGGVHSTLLCQSRKSRKSRKYRIVTSSTSEIF
ncbi:hypothetical protein CDL15_Pgr002310 [Punica granatum]|uniref:Uncharacterized protein n=1 Tax=Punica granatum TaxID=22663 RepID=A0A218XUC3_PUNGR|nr:hypothetical protein CDL15_Pgr002310 [Punica granatum]